MNDEQLHLLAVLIERYGSIIDGVILLETIYPNDKRIMELKNQLDNGKAISDCLNKNKTEKLISFYSQNLPLNVSINAVIERKQLRSKIVKEMISKLSYQGLLLIASIILLFVFNCLVLPTMINSLSIENEQIEHLSNAFHFLNVFVYVLIIVCVFLLSIILWIILAKKEGYVWALLHQYKKDKIFKIIGSYKLASNLKVLLDNGIALEQSLQMLRYDQDDRLLAFISHHYHVSFDNGNDFTESLKMDYLDSKFTSICMYCMQQNSFIEGLADYCLVIEEKIKILIKKISFYIQIFSYSLVAIVVVMSYQVLMLPLELLKEINY